MEEALAIAIFKDALMTVFWVSLPLLAVGLIVGVLISIFQAVTAIREMTLTFVPKIVAVGAVLFLTLPWIIAKLTEFTVRIFDEIGRL